MKRILPFLAVIITSHPYELVTYVDAKNQHILRGSATAKKVPNIAHRRKLPEATLTENKDLSKDKDDTESPPCIISETENSKGNESRTGEADKGDDQSVPECVEIGENEEENSRKQNVKDSVNGDDEENDEDEDIDEKNEAEMEDR
mmetsp:Transcript_23281/g.64581  ORF Transcript_23281/g.64581 Transcript_23281/m.64581 type:complete len:146 (-) Transcript_23281:122-559(-)|eukprot:CAMPEP_0172360956 /NCGR_PEP_ID=MMETSP1060-20121228/4882_1 /TAXON_ID=37318 /ORGANISM="Pseudo-nitzschia pungens, Strain cf. cingulata" /LENGTH=145 /DNA_ID=CAMNT_0013083079 /DNA_START=74 /DNA_END=511 /DNA_ORIENTATION=+